MTFPDFMDRCIDHRWCDLDDRPKIARAFIALCEHIPDKTFNKAPHIHFFAPPSGLYGRTTLMMPARGGDDAVIYLDPSLERKPQALVNFFVAHEFAHALLRHHMPKNQRMSERDLASDYLNQSTEKAADALAVKWGFTLPKIRAGKK